MCCFSSSSMRLFEWRRIVGLLHASVVQLWQLVDRPSKFLPVVWITIIISTRKKNLCQISTYILLHIRRRTMYAYLSHFGPSGTGEYPPRSKPKDTAWMPRRPTSKISYNPRAGAWSSSTPTPAYRPRKGSHRPAFEQMLKDAQKGQFDVIVVDKIDRFYRHLTGLLTALDQLNGFGVSLASVQEKLDLDHSLGQADADRAGHARRDLYR